MARRSGKQEAGEGGEQGRGASREQLTRTDPQHVTAARSPFAIHVAETIDAQGLLTPAQRVVVGLSGGVDSVVLTRTLDTLGYEVVAVHVHHGMRAQSATDDAHFAEALAKELGIAHRLVRLTPGPTASNLEAQMRTARYEALHDEAVRVGATAVAVGHHQDDQLETVLLNLLRGAGLRGLAGMRPQRVLSPKSRVRLVRPLLGIPRGDLVAHAQAEGWTWREDPTNDDPAFRRNALRHRVVPELRATFGPSVAANVARTAALVAAYLEAAPLLRLHEVAGGTHALPLDAVQALPQVLRDDLMLQALVRWLPDAPRSAAVVEAVAALLDAQVGQFVPLGARGPLGQATVWRERDALRFYDHDPRVGWSPVKTTAERMHEDGSTSVETPRGTLTIDMLEAAPSQVQMRSDAPWTVYLDASAVSFPLTLRPWWPADRIQPLGMEGHQSVSDLLTNVQVESATRTGWPVVTSEGQIVWVVGVRIAEVAKVREGTRQCIRLVWRSSGEPAEE